MGPEELEELEEPLSAEALVLERISLRGLTSGLIPPAP
jgi:hypothetical protein